MKKSASIERQILDYLASYPHAQDTLRGIVEWWLQQEKIPPAPAEVEAALNALVARQQLRVKTGPDGQVHYCHPRRGEPGRFADN